MAASMFDAVVHHATLPQRLPRMLTHSSIRKGHGTIYNLPVSYSTHEKTTIRRDSGVRVFQFVGCGGRI